MDERRKWFKAVSSKGDDYEYCKSKHVRLIELKDDFPDHRYLSKECIPCYPEYVFRASRVSHVTDRTGLRGIFNDQGFRGGSDNFLWWNLAVTKNDIFRAATRDQDNFETLKQYTTSLAFQDKSLFGNFLFTFNLRHLLRMYSKQFCDGTAPTLRVLDTRLFKKEIVYSVVVHPKYVTMYRQYRRLPVDSSFHLCGYRKGRMSWRCQSPSDKYDSDLVEDNKEYFVWDNVAVAFHMEPDWVLRVIHSTLFHKLRTCEKASEQPELSIVEAKAEVEELKNYYYYYYY